MALSRRNALKLAIMAPVGITLGSSILAQTQDVWTPETIHNALKQDLARLVDVRRPDEWEDTGVALGAWPIDMTDPMFGERLMIARELANGRPIALICRSGGRSGLIMDQLRQNQTAGFVDVTGGMLGSRSADGWIQLGLPVVSMEAAVAALPIALT